MSGEEVVAEWLSIFVESARKGSLESTLDDFAQKSSGEFISSVEAALWATASIQFRLQVGSPPEGAVAAEIARWLYVMALGRADGVLSFKEWHGIVAAALNDFTVEAPALQMRRIQLLAVLVSVLEVQQRRVPFPADEVNAELERLDEVAARARRDLGLGGRFRSRMRKR